MNRLNQLKMNVLCSLALAFTGYVLVAILAGIPYPSHMREGRPFHFHWSIAEFPIVEYRVWGNGEFFFAMDGPGLPLYLVVATLSLTAFLWMIQFLWARRRQRQNNTDG